MKLHGNHTLETLGIRLMRHLLKVTRHPPIATCCLCQHCPLLFDLINVILRHQIKKCPPIISENVGVSKELSPEAMLTYIYLDQEN